MARETFRLDMPNWVEKKIAEGICPSCMKNPVRTNLRTCSPKCNDYFYKHLCKVFDWNAIRSKVLKRDNYKCVKCGSTDSLEIDHIEPVSLGGSDELDNLQTLCRQHHSEKTKIDVAEWNQKRKEDIGMVDEE